jgi:hypothetical protein
LNSADSYGDMTDPWPTRILAVETNILIIAVRPGEESHRTGGLIAELCRRGRPPFVTILTDGSAGAGPGAEAEAIAARLGAAARRAAGHLGLPAERLLLVGLHDGTPDESPAMLDALVSAYDLLSWARDCQTVCVASDPAGAGGEDDLARCLGDRLSLRAGLGCVLSRDGAAPPPGAASADSGQIDIRRHRAAKARALAEYPAIIGDAAPYERFAVLRAAVEPVRFWRPTPRDQDRTSNMRADVVAS